MMNVEAIKSHYAVQMLIAASSSLHVIDTVALHFPNPESRVKH